MTKVLKIISYCIYGVSYVLHIIGIILFTCAFTLKNTYEYNFSERLKGSKAADWLNISDELNEYINSVDKLFVIAATLLCIAIITFLVAIVLGVIVKNDTKNNETFIGKEFNDYYTLNSEKNSEKKMHLQDEYNYHLPACLYCKSGDYSGMKIPFNKNGRIVIGSSPEVSNIVINNYTNGVSRYHLTVDFEAETDTYILTDYSTYGTYMSNGRRLAKNVPLRVKRGSEIYLSDGKNSFRLE